MFLRGNSHQVILGRSEPPPGSLLKLSHIPFACARRRRVGLDDGSVVRIRRGWRATTTHTVRRVQVDVQDRAPATELAVVTCAEHVATALVRSLCGAIQGRSAVALFGVFQARVVVAIGLAEVDAALDRHAGGIRVAGPRQDPAGFLLVVAALAEVGVDLLDGGRWDVGRQVVETHQASCTTDF